MDLECILASLALSMASTQHLLFAEIGTAHVSDESREIFHMCGYKTLLESI